MLGLVLLHLIPLVHGLQGFATVLHKMHEVLAHVVGLVDAIVSGAVLTETEEDRVNGHLINTDEGVSYQVGKQHRHKYLGPKILNFFVVLEWGKTFRKLTMLEDCLVITYSENVI